MLVNEVRMLTALFENNNKAGKGRRSGSVSGSVADEGLVTICWLKNLDPG